MARIRTIKPEFWTDEKIGSVSIPSRLLLVGALNFADDHGGLDRSSKQLKAQVFPYDAIDCEPLVLELIRAGLLIEYQVADGKYLHIKGFHKHQKVDHPSKFPKTPPYSEGSESPREDGCITIKDGMKEEDAQRALANAREPSRSNHTHKVVIRDDIEEGATVSRGTPRASRSAATRLPEDFKLTPERITYAEQQRVDPQRTFENFRDYWTAASGAKARKCDWDATWRMWCRREQSAPTTNGGGNRFQQQAPNHSAAWAEAKARAKAIGFRDPLPAETPSSYMTDIKRAETTPTAVPIAERRGLAGIKRVTV